MKRNWQKIFLGGVSFLLLVYLLYWRFRLGLARYFDVDEFAHLHWGYNFFIGNKPYADFFYIFPPFFLYPIAAIFSLFGRSVSALIEARVFIFLVFLLFAGVLFLIVRKLRGGWVALLTVVIFAFLPIPSDKMLEIRPDLLATLFSFLGMYFFILGIERDSSTSKESAGWRTPPRCLKVIFLSGLCYAASLGFVPKTLFFLAPALAVLGYKNYKSYKEERSKTFSFLVGGFIPGLICLVMILIFGRGDFRFVLYNITKLASDIHKILGAKFYMRPDIFFYPNDTYYGIAGYSRPYILNLVIYILATFWAIWRFISSLSFKDEKKCIKEFLVAGSFWVNLFAFVKYFPLKHAQYLITVAPFIAFYFADFLESVLEKGSKLLKELKYLMKCAVYLVFLFSVLFVSRQMNERKIVWDNKKTLEKTDKLLSTIPKDSAVFDLTGTAVFFPDGYYMCCLPYGQYEEAFGFNLPNLERDLQKRNTKYVHTDFYNRLDVIPPLQAKYIRDNFTFFFPDGSLLIKK